MAGTQWHVKQFEDALEAFHDHERDYVTAARSKDCPRAAKQWRWLDYLAGAMRSELDALRGEPEEVNLRREMAMAEKTLDSIKAKFRTSCVKAT